MSDRLYLSYWLRDFTEFNMLRHFESALRVFPISRLRPRVHLEVGAVDPAEPPLLEREFAGEIDVGKIIEACRWFRNRDCVFSVGLDWDLWQWEQEWRLGPTIVNVACYAPLFPSEYGEQLRFEFGLEAQFLPQPQHEGSLTPVRHNIRSLLHLVSDLDGELHFDQRKLWSESGGNFAERLQAALGEA